MKINIAIFSLFVILSTTDSTSAKVIMTPAATPELEKAEREFREVKQLLQDSDTNFQKASLQISDRASMNSILNYLQNETTQERQSTLDKLNKQSSMVDLQLSKNLLIKKEDLAKVQSMFQAQISIDNARQNYVKLQSTVMKERQKAIDTYTAPAADSASSETTENQDKLEFIQRVKAEKQNKMYKQLEHEQTDINNQLNAHRCLEVSDKDQKRKELCQSLSEKLNETEDQLHKIDNIADLGNVQIFVSEKKRQSLKEGQVWQESNAITMAKQAAMLYLKNLNKPAENKL